MINLRAGFGVAFLLACFVFGLLVAQPNPKIDSLRSSLFGKQEDTSRIKTLNRLGRHFIVAGNHDSARKYLFRSKQNAEKTQFKSGLVDCLNLLGIINEYESKNPEALALYAQALKLCEEIKDEDGAASTLNNIGIIYFNLGDFEKASDFYIRACRIYDKLGDKVSLAGVEASIGTIFQYQKNFDKAMDYYTRALKIYEGSHDTLGLTVLHTAIALIHIDRKQYDVGLSHSLKGLKFAQKMGDKDGTAVGLIAVGSCYEGKREFQKALHCYLEGIEIYSSVQNKMRFAEASKIIGVLYDTLKNYKLALEYFTRELTVSKEISSRKSLRSAYQSLANHFGLTKDYVNAYKYSKLFSDLNDSLSTEENNQLTANSEAKYQSDKKKKEIDLLLKEGKIKQLVINESRTQIIGLVVGILFLLIFAWLLLQRNKFRSRLKLDAEILRQQDLGLVAVLEAQETERQRIAKDLHDGVGQQLVGLKLSVQDAIAGKNAVAEIPTEKSNRINTILDEVAQEVRSISHQMMPGALVESGLIPALEDMLNKSLSKLAVSYHFEHSNINERFDKNIETNLYRISQELVQNIYKHSGATEVNVQLFKSQNRLILMVEDNGIGMSSEGNVQKGMGLLNITARVKSMKGELSIEPGPFAGTVITIRIPVE